MLPATSTRVSSHTAPHLNQAINRDRERRVLAMKAGNRHALISQRLDDLNREWDVERILQTNFSAISLAALGLATQVNPRWFVLATAVPGFMVQHALQGWCPPLAVLRRLKKRTAHEIGEERFALKALRGDFRELGDSLDVDAVIAAVKK